MKKFVFVLVLVFVSVFAFGQEIETLWTRYYSDMTKEECEQVIGRTIASCILQGNPSVYAKKIDVATPVPFLELEKYNDGNYRFSIASPYYISIIFILKEGFKPNDDGFLPYLEYILTIADPKYAALDMSKYFKKP